MTPRLTSALMVIAALAAIAIVGCSSSSSSKGANRSPAAVTKAANGPVGVFPQAGTPTASPRTQISFRGRSPSALTGISVRGSRSGKHSGKLKAHSDGNGASFIPKRGFRAGETVTVKAGPKLVGERHGTVRFRIARKARLGVPGHVQADPGGNPKGTLRFKSFGLRPPSIRVGRRTSKAAPGDLFLAVKAGPGQDGPMIVDGRGRLVWFRRVPRKTSAFDLRVQHYQGKPVLTFWQGGVHHGQGRGDGFLLDSHYRQIAHVRAGNGYKADFHEFQLSRENTAFFVIYQPVRWDLRSVGGPRNGSVLDGIVQEVDIKTGLVVFEWHSLGHLAPRESYSKPPKAAPFDISHVNSVYEEKNGNLLVSARDTHAALELGRQTGRLIWRLGGKRSHFHMGSGSQFVGQHDVRRAKDGRMTIFDNGSPPSPGRPARALVLKIKGRKVTKSRSFHRRRAIHSPSQGNVQALPNGNFMVGWGGDTPFFDEFTASGKVALDGHIGVTTDDTYRVWKFPWTGTPTGKPGIAARTSSGKTRVYASWNGATEVAQWQVLGGSNADVLLPVAKTGRTGFETTITVPNPQQYVAVRALGSNGQTLGTSKTIKPKH